MQGQEKINVLTQALRKEKGQIPPSSVFHSAQALNRLDDAHPYWRGESTLLSSPIQMLSNLETLSQTHLEIMFYLGTPWSTQVDIKLTITTTV